MKFVGTEEGPRLFCPTCGAATMRSRGGQMRMDATCARCGATTARWRPLGVLLATVSIMWSFMFAAFQVAHIPVVPVLVVCLCACFVAVEIAGRRRFRTATFDEIEAADRLLAEEHAAKTKKAYLAAVEASSPVGEVAEEASDDAEERVGKRAG